MTEAAYGGGASNDRWMNLATYSTQFVMGRMRSVPSTRQMMQTLPAERLMRAQGDGAVYGGSISTATTPILTTAGAPHGVPNPPIPVDAWNNPIIFVPSGGLIIADAYNVNKAYKVGSIVLTSFSTPPMTAVAFRALKAGKLPAPTNADPWEQLPANFQHIVTAPGNRPFWASAGPDGDFQTPDDNIYSFEQ